MLISIITITRNDGPLLRRTFESIASQRVSGKVMIEHIVVDSSDDGGRYAQSLAYITDAKVVYQSPCGCYNALNHAITMINGDIIGIVHGNDILASDDIIEYIANIFKTEKPDFIYGDVEFIKVGHPGISYRYYSSESFNPQSLLHGFAPPHPSLFITSEAMQAVGPYDGSYLIAGDFDLFVRLFLGKHKFKSINIKRVTTLMECGGASSSFKTRLTTSTREKARALTRIGIQHARLRILLRPLAYINQIPTILIHRSLNV